MTGFSQPFFDWNNSKLDFLAKFKLYLQNQGVDPTDNFDDEIITKTNWELINLTDGIGQANLIAVNGYTAIQIGTDGLNEALGQPGTAIVKLRAVEGPWDEDWHVAEDRPTNTVVNLSNAKEKLQDLQYGTIRKGSMTIDKLYRKLLRIDRRANYRPKELRKKFIDALPLPWLEKAEDIGEHLPLDELAKKPYEIELC
ncbi:11393_t:CDS:2 [Acaulospora morrowiae]|uniref:11393_t:CDS:1 n=1 Tax=Acaulospora morrowiae TaxID=94023 RepID=A0A9N8WH42_9GLOM|nr:11393_t:CDS:2 [Acaulospora morrowiae]